MAALKKSIDSGGKAPAKKVRNQRGATAVMPYSARARDGAPVAAPIDWSELDEIAGANAFTIRDAEQLLDRAGSKLLAGWGMAKQKLPDI